MAIKPWSLIDIKEGASKGRKIVVCDGMVYDLTKWIKYHPGGSLVIEHFVGKDATDQIKVMHPPSVREKMKAFLVGKLQDGMDSKPGSAEASHKAISAAFRKLDDELHLKGLYETDYMFYCKKLAVITALFVSALWMTLTFSSAGNSLMLCVAAVLMASAWHQIAFVAHDAGHSGITHRLNVDHLIGVMLGNLIGGISIGWWKDAHYVHHLVTNDPNHDPDIQHLPFFAVSKVFFNNVFSSYYNRTMIFNSFAKISISIQRYLYYPLLLVGRFNLYANSFQFLYTKSHSRFRPLEFSCLALFWVWFLLLLSQIESHADKLAYLLLSHALTFILHIQITLSHWGMSTEKFSSALNDNAEEQTLMDESFISHQLRTTMDIDCPKWLDWFHGGLQFQAIHHLFPRLPRHNLRTVRELVIQFCKKNEITYHCVTFLEGNRIVLNHLLSISNEAKMKYE